ncbi:hypothetical protein PsYK624_152520 [Phanerochaete sordida]|uniref:Uncharacterized protein n=1 Tax=Phanerochaete sordida TaxID=48140 RepID=A0A9P3GRH3_9APHY|nr:hypothetical protein PsYK624_152520 [Phanerochaete sordida]
MTPTAAPPSEPPASASPSSPCFAPALPPPPPPSSPLPPPYTPPDDSPPYALEPAGDERRLDYIASTDNETPRGVYSKQAERVCVTLSDQENGADMPVYGRNALISGFVAIEDKDVCSVSVKLEGRLTMSLMEGGSSYRVLFSTEHSLWTQDDPGECPRPVSFFTPFPSTFTTSLEPYPMPPTFDASFSGTPGLRVQVFYFLSVRVIRPPLWLWRRNTTIVIPVKYRPRSRPYLPISPGLHPFLATVKTAPEEWHQISAAMTSHETGIDPLECHLFIPTVQIFGLQDTIPFHVQVAGSSKSLTFLVDPSASHRASDSNTRRKSPPRSPLKSPYPPRQLSSGCSRAQHASPTEAPSDTAVPQLWSSHRSHLSISGSPDDLKALRAAHTVRDPGEVLVRVYLLRQITSTINGMKAWRNKVIGEGTVWPVGRPQNVKLDERSDRHAALDWAGELRVDRTVSVPSFAVEDLSVKDFIVLHVSPPRPEMSPLDELNIVHPVRLVTDTYRDLGDAA